MMRKTTRTLSALAALALCLFATAPLLRAETPETEAPVEKTVDQKINDFFKPATETVNKVVFAPIYTSPDKNEDGSPQWKVPFILIWLGGGAVFLTFYFRFVNLRAFGLALRTVRGKYSTSSDPGEITHFQALASAVSGTVGLGNIAGVAIGIMLGGPGVAFWLFLSGFLGMATKFAECTLGVKYREITPEGHIHGGAMYYLTKGFAERGLAPVGKVLAILFAIFCVFASFGGGNVFQVNQATSQLINVTGGDGSFFAGRQWLFGTLLAVITGLVIIGGIRGIAKVTARLVPAMCLVYVLSALVVLFPQRRPHPRRHLDDLHRGVPTARRDHRWRARRLHLGHAPRHLLQRSGHRFRPHRPLGRANPHARLGRHRRPARTVPRHGHRLHHDSLVLVTSMYFNGDGGDFTINGQHFTLGDSSNTSTAFGISMTSMAFETVHGGFQYVLFVCVLLFAFSTLITWSYYGLQAWQYLFGRNKAVDLLYKVIFCLVIIAGSSASMGNAVDFSDASLFAMSIPNLIGVYFLLPVIHREVKKFIRFTRLVDGGKSIKDASAEVGAE
ncbi:MAG: alanine:cation symporter family protein [Akkermansiaceae bacterium]|nr:alanine:cation symporter family protein [Akkermansiaceae bacterium]